MGGGGGGGGGRLHAAAAAAAATVRQNWPRMTRTLVAVLLPASLLYLGAGFAQPGSVFATKTYASSVTVRVQLWVETCVCVCLYCLDCKPCS